MPPQSDASSGAAAGVRGVNNSTKVAPSSVENRDIMVSHDSSSDEEESDLDLEGGAPSTSSAQHRRISPPVKIPGASAAHRRNFSRAAGLKSSGDLGALIGDGGIAVATGGDSRYQTQKPLSAPVFSHMTLGTSPNNDETATEGGIIFEPSSTVEIQSPRSSSTTEHKKTGKIDRRRFQQIEQGTSLEESSGSGGNTLTPPTPLGDTPEIPPPAPRLHPPSFTESVTSSTAPFPPSFSPDFPFAFTPSGRYSSSPGSIGTPRGGTGGTAAGIGGVIGTIGTSGGGGGTLPGPFFPGPGTAIGTTTREMGSFPPTYHVQSSPALGGELTSSSTSPSHRSSGNNLTLRRLNTPSSPHIQELVLTGREIPAGTALMRRASWGGRSFLGDPSLGGGGPSVPPVGYSVSPLQESGILESLLSGSTPRSLLRGGSGLVAGRLTHTSSNVSELAAARSVAGGGSSIPGGGKKDQLLLTFPAAGYAAHHYGHGGGHGVSGGRMGIIPREDSEQLPFDFTADSSDNSDEYNGGNGGQSFAGGEMAFASPRIGGGGERAYGQEGHRVDAQRIHGRMSPREGHSPGTIENATAAEVPPLNNTRCAASVNDGRSTPPPPPAFDMASSAAAVGGFVRLLREAQPLAGLGPMPFDSGVEQLDALRSRLQAQGVE